MDSPAPGTESLEFTSIVSVFVFSFVIVLGVSVLVCVFFSLCKPALPPADEENRRCWI